MSDPSHQTTPPQVSKPATIKAETPSHTLSYQMDGRALDYSVAVGLVLLSIGLVALRYLEMIDLLFSQALIPAAYVIISATLYRITLHSTHEAIRLARLDELIDTATRDVSSLAVIKDFIGRDRP